MDYNLFSDFFKRCDIPNKAKIVGNFVKAHKAEIGLGTGALLLGWKNRKLKKYLDDERAKNIGYQELLVKHQAEIEQLKDERKKREYLDELWDKYINDLEE